MAKMAVRRRIVFNPIGVAHRTDLPGPTSDSCSFVPMTLSALQVSECQRVLRLGAVLVTPHAQSIRLVVQLVTCLTPHLGGAHGGRLMTHGTVETGLHMRHMWKISCWVFSKLLRSSARTLVTRRTVHRLDSSMMARVAAR